MAAEQVRHLVVAEEEPATLEAEAAECEKPWPISPREKDAGPVRGQLILRMRRWRVASLRGRASRLPAHLADPTPGHSQRSVCMLFTEALRTVAHGKSH